MITITNPLIAPAKTERIYSDGWISVLNISAIPTPGSTVRPKFTARMVLTAKDAETGEFAPAGTEGVYVIDDLEAMVQNVPELGTAMVNIFAAVTAYVEWVSNQEALAANSEPTTNPDPTA